MSITFIPKNDEQKKWIVAKYVVNADFKKSLPSRMIFFTNGIVRMDELRWMRMLPVSNTKKVFYRAIVYGLRHFDLDKEINSKELWLIIEQEADRTRDAIMKLWSERPFETERELFDEHYKKIFGFEKYNLARVYHMALKDLMTYDFLKYRPAHRGSARLIRVSELCKEVVAMHKERYYVF